MIPTIWKFLAVKKGFFVSESLELALSRSVPSGGNSRAVFGLLARERLCWVLEDDNFILLKDQQRAPRSKSNRRKQPSGVRQPKPSKIRLCFLRGGYKSAHEILHIQNMHILLAKNE